MQTSAEFARSIVTQRLLNLTVTANTDAVASYAAVPTLEPDLTELHLALRDANISHLLPRALPDRHMEWVRDPTDVRRRTKRPRVPEPMGPPITGSVWDHTTVALIPALAVDPIGNRLGQGGGYYDTLLAIKPAHACVVAVVFDDDVLPPGVLPTEPHDAPVTAILTPTRWLDITAHGTA